jgi:hypothetical protein
MEGYIFWSQGVGGTKVYSKEVPIHAGLEQGFFESHSKTVFMPDSVRVPILHSQQLGDTEPLTKGVRIHLDSSQECSSFALYELAVQIPTQRNFFWILTCTRTP